MPHRQSRIDAAKVVASHLIVLHHFTVYGPLADALDAAAPRLTDWFFEYARMAVQVFLVIGGYLAAGSLAPHGYLSRPSPWRSIVQRYFRLALPFGAAILLVVACSAFTRLWLQAEFIPAAPGVMQLLGHFGLFHGVMGIEPLSIGIWYVAIDFQLFALFAVLLWAGARTARWWVALGMLASLFFFNLQSDGDNWAPYFFASYAMGAIAWWAGHSRHAPTILTAMAVVVIAALAWDFRLRTALALVVAIGLGIARWRLAKDASTRVPSRAWSTTLVRRLARSSYALFLTHFAIVMLASAAWVRLGWKFYGSAALVTMCAWGACVLLALVFERYVERPLSAVRIFK